MKEFGIAPDSFLLVAARSVRKLKVKKADGTIITYTGTNGADKVAKW